MRLNDQRPYSILQLFFAYVFLHDPTDKLRFGPVGGATFSKADRFPEKAKRQDRPGVQLCLESPLSTSMDLGAACFRRSVCGFSSRQKHFCRDL